MFQIQHTAHRTLNHLQIIIIVHSPKPVLNTHIRLAKHIFIPQIEFVSFHNILKHFPLLWYRQTAIG